MKVNTKQLEQALRLTKAKDLTLETSQDWLKVTSQNYIHETCTSKVELEDQNKSDLGIKVCVDTSTLKEILKTLKPLKKEWHDFSFNTENGSLKISVYSLWTRIGQEFKTHDLDQTKQMAFRADEIRSIIKHTRTSIGNDETLAAIQRVHHRDGRFVSIDGHRMSVFHSKRSLPEFFIPLEAVHFLKRALAIKNFADHFYFIFDKESGFLEINSLSNFVYQIKIRDDEFLDFDKILKSVKPKYYIRFDREMFENILKVIKPELTPRHKNRVILSCQPGDNKMLVQGYNAKGKYSIAKKEIPIHVSKLKEEYEDLTLDLVLDYKYLQDALESIVHGNRLKIEYNSPDKPLIFKPDVFKDLFVLLPVKLKGR